MRCMARRCAADTLARKAALHNSKRGTGALVVRAVSLTGLPLRCCCRARALGRAGLPRVQTVRALQHEVQGARLT